MKFECLQFNKKATINTELEVNNFRTIIEAKVKQAFSGKEVIVTSNKKTEIVQFFKPFDEWVCENYVQLSNGQ